MCTLQIYGAQKYLRSYLNKLVKASQLANLAITDYEAFISRPFSGKNTNRTEDPKLAQEVYTRSGNSTRHTNEDCHWSRVRARP